MHLTLTALKAHLVMMAAQAKTEAKDIVNDIIQAAHNLEAQAEDLGNPLTLFESHGYGLDEAKRLVEIFESRAKQVIQHVESELGLNTPSAPAAPVPPVRNVAIDNATAGDASTETPPAGNVAEGSGSTGTDPDPSGPGTGDVVGQQGGEGQ